MSTGGFAEQADVGGGREPETSTIGVDGDAEVDEGLLSRLALIDDQPLNERAAAFAQIHDELRQHLDSGGDGDASSRGAL